MAAPFSQDDLISVYQEILNEGIYPTEQELNELAQPDNINSWYWLTSEGRVSILSDLFDKFIFPDPKMLDQCHKKHNANS